MVRVLSVFVIGTALGLAPAAGEDDRCVRSAADMMENLAAGGPVSPAAALESLGACAGIEVAVLGPLATGGAPNLDGLSAGEAVIALSSRQSWVAELETPVPVDEIKGLRRIILFGPSGLARIRGAPTPVAVVGEPADRRAASIRDVVQLSYRSDQASATALRTIASGDGDGAVRAAALSALKTVEGQKAVGFIRDRAILDADPTVRIAGAQALVDMSAPNAVEALRMVLARERDAEVRSAVADLLEELRSP